MTQISLLESFTAKTPMTLNAAQETVKPKVDAWSSNVRCLFPNSKMNVSSVFPWLAAMGTQESATTGWCGAAQYD